MLHGQAVTASQVFYLTFYFYLGANIQPGRWQCQTFLQNEAPTRCLTWPLVDVPGHSSGKQSLPDPAHYVTETNALLAFACGRLAGDRDHADSRS
ncbi:hypothetical protein ElyMa_004429100 [Elysia marginata]|uniref:Uncharacterized protein n=1 Tax=Elysia marginata TaxID=1093978 RepID=A0AAV4HB03_9GAST|nr:hypothetical protein ElyMa_004429100 [Elysia marginata]